MRTSLLWHAVVQYFDVGEVAFQLAVEPRPNTVGFHPLIMLSARHLKQHGVRLGVVVLERQRTEALFCQFLFGGTNHLSNTVAPRLLVLFLLEDVLLHGLLASLFRLSRSGGEHSPPD